MVDFSTFSYSLQCHIPSHGVVIQNPFLFTFLSPACACVWPFLFWSSCKALFSAYGFWKHHHRLDQQAAFHPLFAMIRSVYWNIDLKSAGLVIISIVSIYRQGIFRGFISFQGGRRWSQTFVYHSPTWALWSMTNVKPNDKIVEIQGSKSKIKKSKCHSR